MELTLARNCCLNTDLRNSAGKPLYRARTSYSFFSMITRISRVVEEQDSSSSLCPTLFKVQDDDDGAGSLLETEGLLPLSPKRELAQIHWRVFGSSTLRHGRRECKMADYLRPKGFAHRHRVFEGPDGRSYKWTMKTFNSYLVTNDDSRTPVARTHRRCYGILGKRRKAALEIFSPGMHMVDAIVVTFFYVEHVRRERERASSVFSRMAICDPDYISSQALITNSESQESPYPLSSGIASGIFAYQPQDLEGAIHNAGIKASSSESKEMIAAGFACRNIGGGKSKPCRYCVTRDGRVRSHARVWHASQWLPPPLSWCSPCARPGVFDIQEMTLSAWGYIHYRTW